MNNSRTENSIKNIFVGIGGYVVNTILGLVCRMVFTRTLAAEYLGVNGLFSNILTMLSLAELGIGSAIIYALYKPLATDDRETVAALVQFYGKCYKVIGIIVAAIGLLLMPFLPFLIQERPNIQENIYLIYLIYLFNTASTYFFSYRGSLLAAAQKNYIVTGLNYVITIVQSIVQMILLTTTHNYISYLIVQTLGIFVYNILISYIAKKEYPYITQKSIRTLEKSELLELIRNVKSLVIIKLSGMLVNNTDNIIITYFEGLITVGVASNYLLLSNTISALLSQLFNGINASVGNFNAVESKEKKLGLFNSIGLVSFWLYGWAAIGICLISSDIVQLLFGKDYILEIAIPFVIALNFYILGMQNVVWTYKNTLGLFKPGRYLLLITAGINLVLSVILGNATGLFGIYLATAIARVLTNVWYEPYAVFKYGFERSVKEYYLRYIAYFTILLVTGGICYFLCSLVEFEPAVNCLLKFAICSIVPNVIFLVCFFKKDEFKYLINIGMRLKDKMFNKKGSGK